MSSVASSAAGSSRRFFQMDADFLLGVRRPFFLGHRLQLAYFEVVDALGKRDGLPALRGERIEIGESVSLQWEGLEVDRFLSIHRECFEVCLLVRRLGSLLGGRLFQGFQLEQVFRWTFHLLRLSGLGHQLDVSQAVEVDGLVACDCRGLLRALVEPLSQEVPQDRAPGRLLSPRREQSLPARVEPRAADLPPPRHPLTTGPPESPRPNGSPTVGSVSGARVSSSISGVS